MNRYEHFIRLTIDDEVLVVSPVGVFDGERLEELREAVIAARRLGFARIAVDLAGAEFAVAGAVSSDVVMPRVDFADVEWRNVPHIEAMPASAN